MNYEQAIRRVDELEAENERLKAQLTANTALLEEARKTIDELRVALKWQNLKGGE